MSSREVHRFGGEAGNESWEKTDSNYKSEKQEGIARLTSRIKDLDSENFMRLAVANLLVFRLILNHFPPYIVGMKGVIMMPNNEWA